MLEKQKKYCKENKLPFFAFEKCPNCGYITTDTDKFHITGCEYCNASWCD